jgi:hypothetical protein
MRTIFLIFISIVLFACMQDETQTKNELSSVAIPDLNSIPLEVDMSEQAHDFNSYCQTCHTQRYIEMQPALPRKAWEKIVDKMIHSYGAPVDSLAAKRIVDYLVMIKGK